MGIRTVSYASADLPRLAIDVLCGDVTVLKNVINPELILEARKTIHEWAQSAPESADHPSASGGARHRRSFLPAKSQSRYICHDYEFDPRSGHPVYHKILAVFEVMRQAYCALLSERIEFGETYGGFTLLPQVIQYPRGGGFFQEHFHAVKPQKIGLVLSASRYGKDYMVGGGRFRTGDGSWVTTEGQHDAGDMTLFRYDIGHDITPVDPDAPLDWSRADGRWSFVLPLKPAAQ